MLWTGAPEVHRRPRVHPRAGRPRGPGSRDPLTPKGEDRNGSPATPPSRLPSVSFADLLQRRHPLSPNPSPWPVRRRCGSVDAFLWVSAEAILVFFLSKHPYNKESPPISLRKSFRRPSMSNGLCIVWGGGYPTPVPSLLPGPCRRLRRLPRPLYVVPSHRCLLTGTRPTSVTDIFMYSHRCVNSSRKIQTSVKYS